MVVTDCVDFLHVVSSVVKELTWKVFDFLFVLA